MMIPVINILLLLLLFLLLSELIHNFYEHIIKMNVNEMLNTKKINDILHYIFKEM